MSVSYQLQLKGSTIQKVLLPVFEKSKLLKNYDDVMTWYVNTSRITGTLWKESICDSPHKGQVMWSSDLSLLLAWIGF